MLNEAKLRDEVIIVFVAGVDVGFGPHAADAVEMVDVDVYKDPEETAQDLLAHLLKVLGERNTYNRIGGNHQRLVNEEGTWVAKHIVLMALNEMSLGVYHDSLTRDRGDSKSANEKC